MPIVTPDTGTTLLTGIGPPAPQWLATADGVNDPWRWSPYLYAWVSPAFNVSWLSGAVIPSFTSPDPERHIQLYVGDWTVDALPALADPSGAAVGSDFGLVESYGAYFPSGDATASSDGSGVAFLIQYQAPIPGDAVTNLVPNPSFEVDLSTFDLTYVGDESRVATGVQSGSWAMRHTNINLSAGAATASQDAALMPVLPDTAYTFSAYVSGDRPDARIAVVWYNSTPAAGGTSLGSTVSLTGTPQRVSGTATSPGFAAFARIFCDCPTGDSNTAHYTEHDAFMLTEGSTLHDYFDGDTSGETAWMGTPHNSTSIRTPGLATPVETLPTNPAAPQLDVQQMLGDVAIDSTFTFPPADVAGIGAHDGDYYLDLSGKELYGPRTNGVWLTSASIAAYDETGDFTLSGIVRYASRTEPDDADVPGDTVAAWFDSTPPPVTYVGAGAVAENTVAGTTLAVPYPTGLQAGDQLVLVFSVNNASVPAAQSGFTTVKAFYRSTNTLAPNIYVGIQTATGAETGNFTAATANAVSSGQILAFRNIDQATPQDVAATSYDPGTSQEPVALPTLTTTRPGGVLVYASASNSPTNTHTAPTAPAAFTETGDRTAGRSFTTGYLIWSGSGATGTVTITQSSSAAPVAVLMALRPVNGAVLNLKGHNDSGFVTGSIPLT